MAPPESWCSGEAPLPAHLAEHGLKACVACRSTGEITRGGGIAEVREELMGTKQGNNWGPFVEGCKCLHRPTGNGPYTERSEQESNAREINSNLRKLIN